MPKDNLLIVADSERNADMLYAVGTFVPDPFIWFRSRNRDFVVVSDLELDRVQREAKHCRTLSYTRYERRHERENKGDCPGLGDILCAILRERQIKRVTVAESFPLGLAKALRRHKIKVRLQDGPFFAARAIKSAEEVKKISAALLMAEVGMAEGIHALRRTRIGKARRLMLNQAPLTAERLRAIIDTAILQAGGNSTHTIVAGGRQSSDPHQRGHGELRADEPIVIDIFPRSQRTGYFGDVARTVVRGRADDFTRAMYAAVEQAQAAGMRKLRVGVRGAEVHHTVEESFREAGYKTSRRNGHMEGFFHGTGHGIGLEVHEAPRLNQRSQEILRPGHVVTVEPGLYYPEVGGVRLEDVVLVTRAAPRNLTRFEKQLEI
ncbi:MAG: M24 family metallopeptidase [Limisphaerales bacterium]